jgi:hypothetical protein
MDVGVDAVDVDSAELCVGVAVADISIRIGIVVILVVLSQMVGATDGISMDPKDGATVRDANRTFEYRMISNQTEGCSFAIDGKVMVSGSVVSGQTLDFNYPDVLRNGGSERNWTVSCGNLSVTNRFVFDQTIRIDDEECADETYPNEEDLPSKAMIGVNFTVRSPFGFSNDIAWVNLTLNGVRRSTVCSGTKMTTTDMLYVCNVNMSFYDRPGSYEAEFVTYPYGWENYSVKSDGVSCFYGELLASRIEGGGVGFPEVKPGNKSVKSTTPFVVKNTGNVPIQVVIVASDLVGGGYTLSASNFFVGPYAGASLQMGSGQPVALYGQIDPGENAKEEYYVWMSMPEGQQIASYGTETPWRVVVTE